MTSKRINSMHAFCESASQEKTTNAKKSLLIRIGFSLIIMLFADLAVTFLYKCVTGYDWWLTPTQISEKSYRIPSLFYHHDLAPNQNISSAIWGKYKYPLKTNSLGFKDRATRTIDPQEDVYRVILIGDSFTEGIGIPYEKTFAGLIAANMANDGIEVLNAGVCSYSPIIYWKKSEYLLEHTKLKFNELIVFLDLSDVYDEAKTYSLNEDNHVISSEDSQALTLQKKYISLIKNHSILCYTIGNAIFDWTRTFWTSHMNHKQVYNSTEMRGLWTQNDELYREYGEKGINLMKSHMDQLQALLTKHNIRLVVVVYPWPCQIRAKERNSPQIHIWSSWCEQRNIPFINLFPTLINPQSDTNEIENSIKKYFISGDVHFNEDGHRLIGNAFLQQYRPLVKSHPMNSKWSDTL